MIKQGDGHHVWDFLRIQPNQKQNRRQKPEKFTQYPHLTLAVGDDAVLPIVVLPNGMKGKFRRNLLDLRMEGFLELIRKVEKNLCARLGTVKGCMPWFIALQRRSIRMVEESTLQFDLRTALPKQGKWLGGEVRYQLEWIRAAWKAFENKKHSNIELDIGARFSYDKCRGRLNRRDALDLFAGTWLACKPILDTALQGV